MRVSRKTKRIVRRRRALHWLIHSFLLSSLGIGAGSSTFAATLSPFTCQEATFSGNANGSGGALCSPVVPIDITANGTPYAVGRTSGGIVSLTGDGHGGLTKTGESFFYGSYQGDNYYNTDLFPITFSPGHTGVVTSDNVTNGSIFSWASNGSGIPNNQTQVETVVVNGIVNSIQILAVADLNGDGKDDLLVSNGDTDALEIWLGVGNGSFTLGRSLALGAFDGIDNTTIPPVGDFNRDGVKDVAILLSDVSGNQKMVVVEGSSTGNFQLRDVSRPDSASISTFNEIAAVNLDGAGNYAIVTYDPGQTKLLCYQGINGYALQAPIATTLPAGVLDITRIQAVDLNGDGKSDLLLSTSRSTMGGSSNFATVMRNTGNCTFTAEATSTDYGSTNGNGTLGFADFNGDGQLDAIMVTSNLLLLDRVTSGSFGVTLSAQTGVAVSTVITSNTLTISGQSGPVAISISGGTYSINGGAFASSAGTVSNGDTVRVRLTSSSDFLDQRSATLTVGSYTGTFDVTTGDIPLDNDFQKQTNASFNSTYTSNTVSVINQVGSVPISISGGTYSKNGGPFVSTAGTAINGDTIALRVTSANAYGTSSSATFTINGNTARYDVVTSGDLSLLLSNQYGVALNTSITSNTITVHVDGGSASISITGGSYNINGGAFGNTAGSVHEGDTVAVRLTSAGTSNTVSTATLQIGGAIGTFDVVTAGAFTQTLLPFTCQEQSFGMGYGGHICTPVVPLDITAHGTPHAVGRTPNGIVSLDGDGHGGLVKSGESFFDGQFNFGGSDNNTDLFPITFNTGVTGVVTTKSTSSMITAWLGNGAGIPNAQTVVTTVGDGYKIGAVFDLNGDGKGDLITVSDPGEVTYVNSWLGVGDGSFTLGGSLNPWPYTVDAIHTGDFNNDGMQDAVILMKYFAVDSSTPQKLVIIPGNHAGTISTQDVTRPDIGSRPTLNDMDVANIDGAGNYAILSYDATHILCYPGLNSHTLQAPVITNISASDNSIVGLQAVDLNHDGKTDIYLTTVRSNFSTSSHYASVWRNTGNCTFAPESSVTDVGASNRATGFADLNGDNQLDAILDSNKALLIFLDENAPAFSFSLTAQGNAPVSTAVTSNAITVSGQSGAVPISVTGGTYSVNGGPYVSSAGTVSNGDTVTVRLTSSSVNNTLTSATLTINGVSGVFSVTTAAANQTTALDTTPDPFAFAAKDHVALSTRIESNSIMVTGINAPTTILVAGGQYRIENGAYTSDPGTVNAGQHITLQMLSSAVSLATSKMQVTIGGVNAAFSVTTGNINPAPFLLGSRSNVTRGSLVESDTATITGIDFASPISVSNGDYRINGGAYTHDAGMVQAGDKVQVRLTASAALSGVAFATLTVGSVSGKFTVTSEASAGQTTTSTVTPGTSTGSATGSDGTQSTVEKFPKTPCGSVALPVSKTMQLDDLTITTLLGSENNTQPLMVSALNVTGTPAYRVPAFQSTGAVRVTSSATASRGTPLFASGSCTAVQDLWKVINPGSEAIFLSGEDGRLYAEITIGLVSYADPQSQSNVYIYAGETAAIKVDGSLDYIRVGSMNGRNAPDIGHVQTQIGTSYTTPNVTTSAPHLAGDLADLSASGIPLYNTAYTKLDAEVPRLSAYSGVTTTLRDHIGLSISRAINWKYVPPNSSIAGDEIQFLVPADSGDPVLTTFVVPDPVLASPRGIAYYSTIVTPQPNGDILIANGLISTRLAHTINIKDLTNALLLIQGTAGNAAAQGDGPNKVQVTTTPDALILHLQGHDFPVKVSPYQENSNFYPPVNCTDKSLKLAVCDNTLVWWDLSNDYYTRLLPAFVQDSVAADSLIQYYQQHYNISDKQNIAVGAPSENYIDGQYYLTMPVTRLDPLSKQPIEPPTHFRPGFDLHVRPATCNGVNNTTTAPYCVPAPAAPNGLSPLDIYFTNTFNAQSTPSLVPGTAATVPAPFAQAAIPISTSPVSNLFETLIISPQKSAFEVTIMGNVNALQKIPNGQYIFVWFCKVSPSQLNAADPSAGWQCLDGYRSMSKPDYINGAFMLGFPYYFVAGSTSSTFQRTLLLDNSFTGPKEAGDTLMLGFGASAKYDPAAAFKEMISKNRMGVVYKHY